MRIRTESREDKILKPMAPPTIKYLLTLAISGALLIWFFAAWAWQLRYGLVVTGLGDWGTTGGVPWGIYIGSFIWWVGISHGGILISASVRLFKVRVFYPIARIAELLTIGGLSIAGLFIIVDLGRPDRVVTSVLFNYITTFQTSPLVWDVTVITLYFILTATYLLLTLRHDIYKLRDRLPPYLSPLYWALTQGYSPDEDAKVSRMAWWLALTVFVLAPFLLHGGVIPWLFQLIASMPGWFSTIQAPTFLSIALTSAFGSVTVVSYILRRVFGWEEFLTDKVFAKLGTVLAIVSFFFLWFELQQIITGSFAPPVGLLEATEAKMENPLFWTIIGLVGASIIYLGAQTIWPALFNVKLVVAAAALPVIATLFEKTLFIVEGLAHPEFSIYKGVPGHYVPTWVEYSSVIGSVAIFVLFFTVVSKIIPMIEAESEHEE
ncbi:MAG: NrfD/PsrC family molybdoenzyme membrane anchor subunit [Dehalococcoidales bacterium]|nr:NrfD/PsrC family molybdoenzyme membrane anchor subunit [Dehalococcoidales bacterium]